MANNYLCSGRKSIFYRINVYSNDLCYMKNYTLSNIQNNLTAILAKRW